jgi:hypothetical protein
MYWSICGIFVILKYDYIQENACIDSFAADTTCVFSVYSFLFISNQ